MSPPKLSAADYPLAEKRPELVAGTGGKRLAEITLAAVLDGTVALDDLAITGAALRSQADIARAVGRPTLARNFERAAELVEVPQETIMRVYELLRPGRARTRAELQAAAEELRRVHRATAMAAFVEEAAEVYEQRGLLAR
jgi:propanediol dehydratase small subunit